MWKLLSQACRIFVVGAVVLGGCSSHGGDEPTPDDDLLLPEVAASESPDPTGPLVELGRAEGHFDGKTLTFRSLPLERPSADGVAPQNFGELPIARFDFDTTASIVVNDGNAGPPFAARCLANNNGVNYFGTSSTAQPMPGGGTCANQHLCANVTLKNLATLPNGRTFDNLYVELSDMKPSASFRGDNSVATAAIPTGYGLSNAAGLWAYPSLAPTAVSTFQRWNIFLPDCRDFTFKVAVKGTVRPTAYTSSSLTALSAGDPFQDACVGAGSTRAFPAAPDGVALSTSVSSALEIPFPFTLYDHTYNSSTVRDLVVAASGFVGIAADVTPGLGIPSPRPLPAYRYALFPFWDALGVLPANICYATRGGSAATRDRTFVVTWKNADVLLTLETEQLTFSVVLYESSDIVEFQYGRWTSSATACTTNSRARGGTGLQGAIVGLEGNASTTLTKSQQTAFLSSTSGCPTFGSKFRFTPNPASNVF